MPGLSASASAQASDTGSTLNQQGVSQSVDTRGPDSQTQLNAQGGWQQETAPTQSSSQQDSRPGMEQARSEGQNLSGSGVKMEGEGLSPEKTSQVEAALANAQKSGQNTPSQQPGMDR